MRFLLRTLEPHGVHHFPGVDSNVERQEGGPAVEELGEELKARRRGSAVVVYGGLTPGRAGRPAYRRGKGLRWVDATPREAEIANEAGEFAYSVIGGIKRSMWRGW